MSSVCISRRTELHYRRFRGNRLLDDLDDDRQRSHFPASNKKLKPTIDFGFFFRRIQMHRRRRLVKRPPKLIEIVNHFGSTNAIISTNISNTNPVGTKQTRRVVSRRRRIKSQFKRCQLSLLDPEKYLPFQIS